MSHFPLLMTFSLSSEQRVGRFLFWIKIGSFLCCLVDGFECQRDRHNTLSISKREQRSHLSLYHLLVALLFSVICFAWKKKWHMRGQRRIAGSRIRAYTALLVKCFSPSTLALISIGRVNSLHNTLMGDVTE